MIKYNWVRGFVRIWILLSAIWVGSQFYLKHEILFEGEYKDPSNCSGEYDDAALKLKYGSISAIELNNKKSEMADNCRAREENLQKDQFEYKMGTYLRIGLPVFVAPILLFVLFQIFR